MNYQRERKRCDKLLAEYRAAKSAVVRERRARKEARRSVADAAEAVTIAQEVAEAVQRQAHQHIAGMVTRCLAAVFDNPYTFEIRFDQKRNRTEARAVLVRDGEEHDPLSATGGGVVDVTAFALRLAVLLTRHPAPRRILILDEPFRFVSAEYRPRVRVLLETLADELDFQLVLVSHITDMEIGNVVRID